MFVCTIQEVKIGLCSFLFIAAQPSLQRFPTDDVPRDINAPQARPCISFTRKFGGKLTMVSIVCMQRNWKLLSLKNFELFLTEIC